MTGIADACDAGHRQDWLEAETWTVEVVNSNR
jgi:hypothetical protein